MRRACDALAWPALTCALLLCARASHAAATDTNKNGICSSMDIRNNVEQIKRLQGCRVIEGQLSIVLLEHATEKDFRGISFPELREITGYLVVYRTKGLTNLGTLFPNLAVIRGMQLFKDFALIIFDTELVSLGLKSLVKIERGGVRIQQNDKLCYTNTIDWSRITPKDANNIVRLNYDTRLCGLCPNAQSRMEDHRQLAVQCPSDSYGRLLCWDSKYCQIECPAKCEDNGCMPNRECCDKRCLGGCDGPTAKDCHVCRNYTFTPDDGTSLCTENCPAQTYKLSRRCVTQQECRNATPPSDGDQRLDANKATIPAYKIFRDECVYICPAGYMEVGTTNNATCVPCPASGCVKHCSGRKVDSIAAALQYSGCTHVDGKLEICIRGSAANTLAVLEESLGEIREINGSLQVSRAYPLVSLMFLRSLRKITGTGAPQFKVLQVFNNPNLELLWDWTSRNISISGGSLFINFNPKLCYNRILPLKNMTSDPVSNFTELEVSQDSNGDQASCWPDRLVLEVSQLRSTVVLLTWNNYCPDDIRRLLGYSIYYISTESNVTLYGQRDACFDTWTALDLTKDEAQRNLTKSDEPPLKLGMKQEDILVNPCKALQPNFYPITQLTPYTRYAAYVKTYTTFQEKKGAQSPIIYFRTLPGRPSPPLSLTVTPLSADTVSIAWSPPAMPNGTIESYHVAVQANSYNKPMILEGNINYCANPNAISNKISARLDEAPPRAQEEKTGAVPNGTCACSAEEEAKPSVKFTSRAEDERMETIGFENDLQNQVYRKSDKPRSKPMKRIKRAVDQTLSSMLVELARSTDPKLGATYHNETDDMNYVKSQYYKLGGEVLSLNVSGMRHFTWYTVNVWACRSKHQNESQLDYDQKWCSLRAFQTFRTPELVNADVVSNVRAVIVSSNKTLAEVNVTWDAPANPNGFVVAYNVHYTRVEDATQGTEVGLQGCVPAGERGRLVYPLRNVQPGNYSLKVTPITVAGAGNLSRQVFFYIRERTVDTGYEWIWGVIGGCLVIMLLLAGGIWYARRGLLPSAEANKLFASVNPEYVSTVYVPDEWEVPRAHIEFLRELGQGSFGMVYEGIAKNIEKGKPETRCAVKTVNEHATDRERHEFLNEASVMKAFDTFHVVRLLGVVSRGQPTLVIMELMECGDLKTYLRSHRPDADASLPKKGPINGPPSLQNILQMAIEIADGMAYLSAKKFVHRDLAARNCMVAGDLTVKVGDFGMTRDIYETDYYRKGSKGLLPVRWMSPESLKDGVFSSSSDVWSFGVVLWEMATLAMQPYQGLSNEQVVRYVVEGGVMERPEHCPDRLYELMRACWAHRPNQRPSFLQLVADLVPSSQPYFRHRSFFHTPQGKEMYALQRSAMEEEQEAPVNVGAVATGSGDLFGVSGRLASWVRELASLRSRASDDAAAEPLQPLRRRADVKPANGAPPASPAPPPAPC